jgi:hypothetical protein
VDSAIQALLVVAALNLTATAWLGVAVWRSKQIGVAMMVAAARRRSRK